MNVDWKRYKDELLFVPLGGSNEIGMNLNLYYYQGKWLMVDFGMGFADDYLPGIELIVPDIKFILDRKEDLLGIVLTHAHEDHLGAMPYLWQELECPVYATPFTASFLRKKMQESPHGRKLKIHHVEAGKHYDLGPFGIEMIPLTHSIPEMHALAIRTGAGTVMHTGDWKLDPKPMVGPVSDEATLRKYGDESVLAMVCDSTNVFVEGESGSEADVRASLANLIKQQKNRVAVATFASNVARLESIILAATEAGRKVALAGRSLRRILEAAQETGYLLDIPELLDERTGANYPKDEVLFVCTGCQGEPRAALTKIATGEHHQIKFAAGDSVIFASRVIPGNETRINWLMNKLSRMQVEVLTEKDHFVHVSGHPARSELARMYQLVRPKIALPVHGEPRHIHAHARYARELQVPEAVEPYNGCVVLLKEGSANIVGQVESGYVAVDGSTLIPTDSPIIRTRRKLRDMGCVIVSVVTDARGELAADPQITAPGALDPKEDGDLIDGMIEEIEEALNKIRGRKANYAQRKEAIYLAVRRYLTQEIDKKPIVEILLSEV